VNPHGGAISLVGSQIDVATVQVDLVFQFRGGGDAPQDSSYPGKRLGKHKPLREVVICARVQRSGPAVSPAIAYQRDNSRIRPGPYVPADSIKSASLKIGIENQHVVQSGAALLQRLADSSASSTEWPSCSRADRRSVDLFAAVRLCRLR
jgi:hypothetical protein